jgi:hypothetical protein
MISDNEWKRMWESYFADLNRRCGNIPEEYKSKHNLHGVPFLIPPITAITMMCLAGMDNYLRQYSKPDMWTSKSR